MPRDPPGRRLPAGDPSATTLDVDALRVSPPGRLGEVFVKNGGLGIVEGALDSAACDAVRDRCQRILAEMLRIDGQRHGNRGAGRYSMGAAAASGQQLHQAEWALLLTDPVLDALDSVYGEGGYVLSGGGGEIVLGGIDEGQDLHADISKQPPSCDAKERPPLMVVNFAVHDIWEDHGPTRLCPGRGRPMDRARPMRQDAEPPEMWRSTLAPMRAGSCVVRDARIWHGGTPNRRSYPRYLPNLEFFSKEYFESVRASDFQGRFGGTLPHEVFEMLSKRAQRVACGVLASVPPPVGLKRNFVRPQGRIFRELLLAKLARVPIGGEFTFAGNGFECHLALDIVQSLGTFRATLAAAGGPRRVVATRMSV